MKVLVIGKGGREHALVWKLAQSPRVERVFCAPGNAGTGLDGVNVPIDPNDFDKLIAFAKKEQIGLTVVGPEEPLARGIVDAFQNEGLRIFGPTKAAARLESSKKFAKELMHHADVPTAGFHIFDHPDPARQYLHSRNYVVVDGQTIKGPFTAEHLVVEDGKTYVQVYKAVEGERRFVTLNRPTPRDEPMKISTVKVPLGPSQPCVVKADGLAAGKGVYVCDNTVEAIAAVERIMVKEEFGRTPDGSPGGSVMKVIIEDRLQGEELSVLALVAGRTIVPLPACQDHKRAGDGDTGPNTGGMGAYCPAPLGTPQLLADVEAKVLVPTVHAMKRRRLPEDDYKPAPFRRVLYAGLMITGKGPRVLEYNCRLGDPECQPLLLRLRTDLLDVFEAVVDERLAELGPLEWDERPAACVVMASKGYPGH